MSETLIILHIIISINILTKHEASYQENPYRVAEIIGIEEGMIIGEAGAGDGYYSFLFSGFVGNTGHIYTNEIDRKLLKAINEQCSDRNITNITAVKGKISDPKFPVDTLELVFMRHVLHCMKKPGRWLGNLGKYMKPGARLVIIDGDPDIVGYGHDYLIRKEEVLRMTEKSGFVLDKLETILLPEDYIYIFRKKT